MLVCRFARPRPPLPTQGPAALVAQSEDATELANSYYLTSPLLPNGYYVPDTADIDVDAGYSCSSFSVNVSSYAATTQVLVTVGARSSYNFVDVLANLTFSFTAPRTCRPPRSSPPPLRPPLASRPPPPLLRPPPSPSPPPAAFARHRLRHHLRHHLLLPGPFVLHRHHPGTQAAPGASPIQVSSSSWQKPGNRDQNFEPRSKSQPGTKFGDRPRQPEGRGARADAS